MQQQRFIPTPINWPRHPACRKLRQEDPINESRWLWLVNQAHVANKGGAIVLSDGTPLGVGDFADEHDQDLQGWQTCLQMCEQLGLLERAERCWKIPLPYWEIFHRDPGVAGDRFIPVPLDWPRHPTCRRMRKADKSSESRWLWLMHIAHVANRGGAVVLSDGTPLEALDLADEHDHDLNGWEQSLQLFEQFRLLERTEKGFRLLLWWYRDGKAIRKEEERREKARVKKQKQRAKTVVPPSSSNCPPVVPRVSPPCPPCVPPLSPTCPPHVPRVPQVSPSCPPPHARADLDHRSEIIDHRKDSDQIKREPRAGPSQEPAFESKPPERELDLNLLSKKISKILLPAYSPMMGQREVSDSDKKFVREKMRAPVWRRCKDPEVRAYALAWSCRRTMEQIELAKTGKVKMVNRPWAYAVAMAPDLFEVIQGLVRQNRRAVSAGYDPQPVVYRPHYLPERMRKKAAR